MYIKEHNKEAYNKVREQLAVANRTCVVMPTGTGKSYVALQLIRDNMDKNILFLTSQNGALSHFVGLAKEELGYNSFDTALYAGTKNLPEHKQYDYIILDEFHRCGADVWGESTLNIIEHNKEAKILGMSATPIRFLDDMRNMAEEIFCGNIAYEMKLSEAIATGILQWPYYAVGIISLEKDIKRLEVKFKNGPRKNDKSIAIAIETAKRNIHEAGELPEFFKKHLIKPTGHYLVFCPNIEKLNDYLKEANKWFADVSERINIYTVHSLKKYNAKTVQDFLADTTEGTLKLLFCVDMLNEGLHADEIDGIIMLRNTSSPNVYLQQLGRALSTSGKIAPLVLDVVDNMSCFSIIESIGKEVEEIQQIKGFSNSKVKFVISSEIRNLVAELKAIEKSLEFTWIDWYTLAKDYYKEHGNLLIPAKYEVDGMVLGYWIETQRQAYKKGELVIERIQALEDIGMVWNTFNETWERNYTLAKDYYEEHGDLLIPRKYTVDDILLGEWIKHQRTAYKNGKLSNKRIQALEAIGMTWNPNDETWCQYYAHAREYHEQHGDLLVSKRYKKDDVFLGEWIGKQRAAYKKGSLSAQRIRALEAIGMVWEVVNSNAWKDMYALAREYYEKYGDLLVPSTYTVNGINLGNWIGTQRTRYKKCKLSVERIQMLEAIGMVWEVVNPNAWEDMYALAKKYYENHGDLIVPHNHKMGEIALGQWIIRQRQLYKNNNISEHRVQELEKIGMVWNVKSTWEGTYAHAKVYYEEHGDLLIPRKYTVDDISLGQWIGTQRQSYKKGELVIERIQALEDIGMVWNTFNETWERNYTLAKDYYEEHGDLLIPRKYTVDDILLGEWIKHQRTAYKNGKLSADKIQALEDIGMVWQVK